MPGLDLLAEYGDEACAVGGEEGGAEGGGEEGFVHFGGEGADVVEV